MIIEKYEGVKQIMQSESHTAAAAGKAPHSRLVLKVLFECVCECVCVLSLLRSVKLENICFIRFSLFEAKKEKSSIVCA